MGGSEEPLKRDGGSTHRAERGAVAGSSLGLAAGLHQGPHKGSRVAGEEGAGP